KIAGLPAANVSSIRFRVRGGEEVALERLADEQWRIVEPRRVAANRSRVSGLLGLLALVPVASYDKLDTKPEQLGLAEPEARIWFNESMLVIGGQEPIGGGRVIQLGNKVHVIYEDEVLSLMKTGARGLADDRLLPDGDRVSTISLPGMQLTRTDEGWRSEPPSGSDELSAGELAQAWLQARARFLDWIPIVADDRDNGSAAGSAVGAPGIEVTLKGGSAYTLHPAGGPDLATLYRKDLGISYHLDEALYRRLLTQP
ncbi:MAG: hypothetical protein ACPG4N_05705, partial [Gammaproteobacteria bacterium]